MQRLCNRRTQSEGYSEGLNEQVMNGLCEAAIIDVYIYERTNSMRRRICNLAKLGNEQGTGSPRWLRDCRHGLGANRQRDGASKSKKASLDGKSKQGLQVAIGCHKRHRSRSDEGRLLLSCDLAGRRGSKSWCAHWCKTGSGLDFRRHRPFLPSTCT